MRPEAQAKGIREGRQEVFTKSTVMQALHRATGVIREYQSDSSSKRPRCPLPGTPEKDRDSMMAE